MLCEVEEKSELENPDKEPTVGIVGPSDEIGRIL